MAEVDFHSKQFLKLFMFLQQNIVVGTDTCKFGKSLLDPLECPMHMGNGDIKNLLNEADSDLTAGKGKQDTLSGLPRYDEIRFRIAHALSFLYVLRPFINEGAIRELGYFDSFPPPFSLLSLYDPMPCDLTAVCALNVSADAVF